MNIDVYKIPIPQNSEVKWERVVERQKGWGGTDGIEKMRDKRTSIGRTLTPPYLTGTHKYIYKRYTSM